MSNPLHIFSIPLCFLLAASTIMASARRVQPDVTIIEYILQRESYSSISMPEGSPWCQGNKTFWFVGHQRNETPWCFDEESSTWSSPGLAMLDNEDYLDPDPPILDRHGCATLDVNNDTLPDIICGVGANKGNGVGYPELYITQPDGSVVKELNNGMRDNPTIRDRFLGVLRNSVDPGNPTQVVVAAYAKTRSDGELNTHYMYQFQPEPPYFVNGHTLSYEKTGVAEQLQIFDWNQDGRDDFAIFHRGKYWALFYEQQEGGSFEKVKYPKGVRTNRMRSARFADMNGDGVVDLIVTTHPFRKKTRQIPSRVKVFLGTENGTSPWDFEEHYFVANLPNEAPDLEIFDANQDGIPDIYVIQTNMTGYCGENVKKYLRGSFASWVSPQDTANDFVFLGKGSDYPMRKRFKKVEMDFEINGCGYKVEKFGDDMTLALANGDAGHFGSFALLSWDFNNTA